MPSNMSRTKELSMSLSTCTKEDWELVEKMGDLSRSVAMWMLKVVMTWPMPSRADLFPFKWEPTTGKSIRVEFGKFAQREFWILGFYWWE